MKSIYESAVRTMLMMLFLAAGILLLPAGAQAKTVKVNYGGSTHTYYKTIETVYVNGKKLNLSKCPVYLKSGCYVGPANNIFKAGLKLGYKTGNKTTPRTLTIKNGSKTLILKDGQKKASLNQKNTSLGAAPWRVKYMATKKVYWVVPLKSLCKRLGLHYKLEDGVIYIDTKNDEEESTEDKPATASTQSKLPTSIANRSTGRKIILVIDAGHGGPDNGASANWDKPNSIEKNMNLKIVKEAKAYFDKDRHFKVYYTRTTDCYPTLEQRYELANSKKADLFISVHINSYKSSSKGTETLYSAPRSPKTKKNGITSKELASCMQVYARNATGFVNRGIVNRPRLKVLKYTKMPSCIIEYGFISNKSEFTSMHMNYSKYGRALYNGVVNITRKHGLYK